MEQKSLISCNYHFLQIFNKKNFERVSFSKRFFLILPELFSETTAPILLKFAQLFDTSKGMVNHNLLKILSF